MKVQITRDVDHPITPARLQAFKAGWTGNLPKATAEALIAQGAAQLVAPATPTAHKED